MGKALLEEAKANVKTKQKKQKEILKQEKAMKNRPKIETLKTILITILITGIIAFIGGMQYESQRTAEVQQQAEALTATLITDLKD